MRQHRSYSPEQKAETVGRALVDGSKQVSRETGIPRRTIDYWVTSPAFAALRQRARDEIADQMWAGVQVALVEVIEGLKNPKAPLRDKAAALNVLYDKHALLTGSATARTEARDITGTLSDAELQAALHTAERLVAGVADEAPGSPEG